MKRSNRRRLSLLSCFYLGVAVPLAWLCAPAFSSVHAAAPARAAVTIENYAFQPDPINIAVGATVVWTNRDEVVHNVISRDRLFTSPDLEANQRFEFTFKKAGTFDYYCSIHPEMKGRITVR